MHVDPSMHQIEGLRFPMVYPGTSHSTIYASILVALFPLQCAAHILPRGVLLGMALQFPGYLILQLCR